MSQHLIGIGFKNPVEPTKPFHQYSGDYCSATMGFAFGLFAVFSMLRYRTESISIKEMTYLFLVIAIALLSAVSTLSTYELSLINLAICSMTYLLETSLILPSLEEIEIEYEKIDNININRRLKLIEDIKTRTGLNVVQVEILSIDFLRDCTRLKIHITPTKKSEKTLAGTADTHA